MSAFTSPLCLRTNRVSTDVSFCSVLTTKALHRLPKSKRSASRFCGALSYGNLFKTFICQWFLRFVSTPQRQSCCRPPHQQQLLLASERSTSNCGCHRPFQPIFANRAHSRDWCGRKVASASRSCPTAWKMFADSSAYSRVLPSSSDSMYLGPDSAQAQESDPSTLAFRRSSIV